MLKLVKRTIPLETEGTINRLKADLSEATGGGEAVPFKAEKTYAEGDVIVNAGHIFHATSVIISGETVRPGINCTETTMEEVINTLQKEE